MLARTERACLVIADISGYTAYLAGSELDHAQDVLSDLIETVVGALRPVLRIAKFEGDGVFAHAPEPKSSGSMLLDTLDECYFVFQRRLQSIRQATTCQCNACALIPSLTLKFFVHAGEVARHRIAGREELVGTDVVVVHRLTKNNVADVFHLRGYALFTEAFVAAAGVDPAALNMRPHRETYEHLGDVLTYVHDLEARWTVERERRRVIVPPENAEVTLEILLAGPPALAWEYLTDPARRMEWQDETERVDQKNEGGRRGVGTTNHCVHGDGTVVEEILDWRPFHYFTQSSIIPGLGPAKFTFGLEPVDAGTRLLIRMEKIRSRKQQETWKAMREALLPMLGRWYARLADLLAQEVAARAAEPEAPLPESRAHAH
jgi:uncharacterized protein YndB with AHSA1/START domain/class 3 adenylate cyclase